MIPFDATALLVMLLTFYPIVGPAALARARQERPDYFAGGDIRGTEGDKLWLGDGRKFDLIFQVNTPGQAWQVLELTGQPGDPGDADPFALEDGPLSPIDESAFPAPAPRSVFADLVGAELAPLDAHDAGLATAHATIYDAADPGAIEDAGRETDEALARLEGHAAYLLTADPSDVIATTDAHNTAITGHEAEVSEGIPGPFTAPIPGPPEPEPEPTPPIDVPIVEQP